MKGSSEDWGLDRNCILSLSHLIHIVSYNFIDNIKRLFQKRARADKETS